MTTEDKSPTGEMVPVEMGLVAPVDAESILAAFRRFEWLMKNVVGPGDRQKVGSRSFIKKSGCLKVALACNMSLEKREEHVEKDGDETVYHFTYRAIASTGRFADADASASSGERNFTHIPHDIRALAQTRACNRAILNLSAAGEVSFEEMSPESKTLDSNPKSILKTVTLKKGWTWNRVFTELGPEIEKRQKELGEEKFSFEFAAVVVAREKGCVKKQKKKGLDQELPQ